MIESMVTDILAQTFLMNMSLYYSTNAEDLDLLAAILGRN